MLYLDASALVKRYVREPGSEKVNELFLREERLFTSILSYAEVHAALGRKYRAQELARAQFDRARERFVNDFVLVLNVLEMNTGTMAAVPSLVERFAIRGADLVHLSAVLWLRDMTRLSPQFAAGDEKLEFGTADKELTSFARDSRLAVLTL